MSYVKAIKNKEGKRGNSGTPNFFLNLVLNYFLLFTQKKQKKYQFLAR